MNNFFLSVFFVLLTVPVFGQSTPGFSVVHDMYDIDSVYVKEKRSILVHVPLSYKRNKRAYPVVYMLDGHTPHSEMMAGILANQSWGRVMPEMILVSISNTDRTRDMTPTRVERFATSGGAGNFLDYIEKEVKPLVEKNYRTAPYRIFAGHSFAGLTVAYTLVNRPEMFDAYIAASPYFQWDDDLVVKQAAEKFDGAKLEKTAYFALANEPEYEDAWKKFQDILKKTRPKGLEYEFKRYMDDNHGSVVLPAYHAGLRKVFEGWELTGRVRIEDVISHYKELSKRFGYTISPPEDDMNMSGYRLMRENKFEDALAVFKTNAANYPESANVYDSLGECLEKMGRKKDAAENYRKAYEMATAAGNTLLAATAKANLERVTKLTNDH